MKKNVLFLLFIFLFSHLASAQCIQGDCNNGYGLYRTGRTYQLGQWKNGKAEGQGMRVIFYDVSIYKTSTESDFLLLSAFGQPSPDEVMKLKPQMVITGKFYNGELNGDGKLYATDIKKLPEYNWLLRFVSAWIGGTWNWEKMEYTGEFADTKPLGRGSIQLNVNDGKIICVGNNLGNLTNPDVIVEADVKRFPKKALFRGSFVNGGPHGFTITNAQGYSGMFADGLRRQIWLHGHLQYNGEGNNYPADEAGAVTLQIADDLTYAGPLDAAKLPQGFGTLIKKTANGKESWKYTGYFFKGQASGLGIKEINADTSVTLLGYFSGDTLDKGVVALSSPGFFQYTSGNRFDARTHTMKGGYGYRGLWAGREAYETGEKPVYHYNGDFNENGLRHGRGTITQGAVEKTAMFNNDFLVKQISGTIDRSALYNGAVIVLDGWASPVKLTVRGWETYGGKKVPETSKLQLSKLTLGHFTGSCGSCNGSGKQAQAHRVEASTTTFSSSFSTISGGGYMDSYWKKTTTTTYGYTIPAYTRYTYSSCGACNGWGKTESAAPVKEPE